MTAKFGFLFCLADETLDGDGDERVIWRRRVRRRRGDGGRARVVGLGHQDQRRRRRCPLRSRHRENEEIIFGLERSFGVSDLRMILCFFTLVDNVYGKRLSSSEHDYLELRSHTNNADPPPSFPQDLRLEYLCAACF